ncbi:MAG TPA: 8-amino-7-oxononanoate synthase [Luteibaculaceae bacterium]|nr:8-amino-7-oxononanoate synthase [Luteibaculaceae bacterium]
MNLHKRIEAKLEQKALEGSLRTLKPVVGIDFCSNRYLGSLASPEEITAWLSEFPFDQGYGSGGSRLISGTHPAHEAFEYFLSREFAAEQALLFNSGYDANVGFFSALPSREDTILYDQLAHASIRDGIRLSLAKSLSFNHNDMQDLENKLSKSEGLTWVVVESVYSMDGDQAPLAELCRLCEKYGAALVVDEAHAVGVLGSGKGLCVDLDLSHRVFARLITFGKAIGAHGAAWLSTKAVIYFLINHARSFIYTTALPPLDVYITHQLLVKALEASVLRIELQAKVDYFREMLAHQSALLPSQTPIQGFLVPGNEEVLAKAKQLNQAGIACKAIRYPTVPRGTERLRIIIHAFNTYSELDHLIHTLNNHGT